PGGEHALIEYLANNIKYPEDARKKGIEGMVIVHFVVEKDGTLSSFSNLKSPDETLYQEAVRVLQSMPKFTPGMKDGNPVRVKYTLPVRVKL
ncbi:MAG: energy transducer TonB, partial [Saprospiraceae bacterium]|nr:energy transducer TonB [Saprospiraceae bacterium]